MSTLLIVASSIAFILLICSIFTTWKKKNYYNDFSVGAGFMFAFLCVIFASSVVGLLIDWKTETSQIYPVIEYNKTKEIVIVNYKYDGENHIQEYTEVNIHEFDSIFTKNTTWNHYETFDHFGIGDNGGISYTNPEVETKPDEIITKEYKNPEKSDGVKLIISETKVINEIAGEDTTIYIGKEKKKNKNNIIKLN